ncbi:MAG: aminomethyltransferase family protein [Planctomycetota bacterium]|jgi:aminomethyltransferase
MPLPSPFHERTSALCESLKFKSWAGYFAVCSYESHPDPEYFAFRNAAGLLDITPLFKYEVRGADSAAFLSYLATRDVSSLQIGRVSYSCFCDEEGKVIDDGTISRLDDQRFRVTTGSPAYAWFVQNSRGFQVEIQDVSESTAALAIQGPNSRHVLAELVGSGIEELRFFGLVAASIAGVEVEITRTGYTGDLGFEIWIPREGALSVWDAIMAAGKPHGILPVGLDALDIVRIEAGFLLQDVDYFSAPRCIIDSRKSTPYEIGLGFTVALDRPRFIGQQALQEEKRRGSEWGFVGLEISWEGIEEIYAEYGLPPSLATQACRQAVPVYSTTGRQVGQVTSSTWSPILKKYLALATVEANQVEVGNEVRVEHTVEYERMRVLATVVDRPFYDPERKRT